MSAKTTVRPPKRYVPFTVGLILGTALAVGYILWGPWGRIPLVNQSTPSAPWAQTAFWPGLEVGRWTFHQCWPGHSLDTAKLIAGAAGVLTIGLLYGLILHLLSRIRISWG